MILLRSSDKRRHIGLVTSANSKWPGEFGHCKSLQHIRNTGDHRGRNVRVPTAGAHKVAPPRESEAFWLRWTHARKIPRPAWEGAIVYDYCGHMVSIMRKIS